MVDVAIGNARAAVMVFPDPTQALVLDPHNRNESRGGVCFAHSNLSKIDILLTFQCNAACEHCLTSSNPSRQEWLTTQEVLEVLRCGREHGKSYVSFTGGEPFLRYAMLKQLVLEAKRLGYFVASDTNAFWGRERHVAWRRVAELVELGLNALFPSADAYHLPFVRLEAVRNVLDACEAHGLTCETNFAPGPDPVVNQEILEALDLRRRGYFCDGLTLTGNDVSHLQRLYPHRLASEMDDVGSMHMGISPRGDVYANVDISYEGRELQGTPLALGNLRRAPFEQMLAVERSCPELRVMRCKSPSESHRYLLDGASGVHYREDLADQRYYSATEFWLALFHSAHRGDYRDALRTWGLALPPDS